MTRSVLVTGASKGIGKAIALNLAKDGFKIAVHYHSDKESAKETLDQIKSLNGDGFLIQFDSKNGTQTKDVIEKVIEKNGAFYGVVNNAGIAKDVAFPMMSKDDWHSVIHTNLDSFYHVIQPCIMPMIALRGGGRIITIASVSGIIGNRGQVNYSASKAGIIGATKALAVELAKRKITVNCVAPGLIKTKMTENLEHYDEMLKAIPLKRAGEPQEVADCVSFLASDKAAYITRQVISINGGLA